MDPCPYIALNGGFVLEFNTTGPFNDVRHGRLWLWRIDLKDLVKVNDQGAFDPIDSVFQHISPFYDPTITPAEI